MPGAFVPGELPLVVCLFERARVPAVGRDRRASFESIREGPVHAHQWLCTDANLGGAVQAIPPAGSILFLVSKQDGLRTDHEFTDIDS